MFAIITVNAKKRVVIENVRPEIDQGEVAVRRVLGERVIVEADIFADGFEQISALLSYRGPQETKSHLIPLKHLVNDRWQGEFTVTELGLYHFTLQAWVDHFKTWQAELKKKIASSFNIKTELLAGAEFIEQAARRAEENDARSLWTWARLLKTAKDLRMSASLALSHELSAMMACYPDKKHITNYDHELKVLVDRPKALFSTWYQLFPRSCADRPFQHGTFTDCAKRLPEIARIGFDTLYLPPIHPIGRRNRRGKNNATDAGPEDPGSPWAIGSAEGGHKAIHPELGTLADFDKFMAKCRQHGLEVALDLSFHCSWDHPYLREHPEWFHRGPNGTIQPAENPPHKYDDIVKFNFGCEEWESLWQELKSIVEFWIARGVKAFRIDNPHAKPFSFWEWLLTEIKGKHPDTIFLAESFTRPKVMYRLAKAGFDQSYTYFTWRNTKREFVDYLNELTKTEIHEYFRPNFWPNTPDILPDFLQHGGRPAFITRLILAATLSSNYGIYGPAFELVEERALSGKEEYANSEKYELKVWDWNKPGNLRDLIARVNRIRQENGALQQTNNLTFHQVDNDQLLYYLKRTNDLDNILLVVVNLDPFHMQGGRIQVPIWELDISPDQSYLVHDLLTDDKFIWQGEWNYVALNPAISPAQIFRVHRLMRRENNFDYYVN